MITTRALTTLRDDFKRMSYSLIGYRELPEQNRAILRSRGEVVEGKRSNHFSPSHTSQPNSELAKIDSDASNRFGGRNGKPSVTFCAILAVIDLSFLSISQPRFKRTLHQQGLASR